jgi:general secretion pathway protein C
MLKDGKKTEIIYLDYSYKGYELVEVKDNEGIFKSRGKFYSLKLDEVKKKRRRNSKNKKDVADTLLENEKIEENIKVKSSINPETNEIESAKIKRKDINFYMKNVSQIWKNIRIKDYRVDRRLRGFKVTYVKKGSAFDSLGLKSGDIITAINGEEIHSYSQVQKFYKNINRIKQLNLTISRKGEERDIEYDIN